MTTTAPATTQKKDKPLGQSQFSVAWQQFRKNRLAQAGGLMLILLYVMAIFAPFIAPDALSSYSTSNITRGGQVDAPLAEASCFMRDRWGEAKGQAECLTSSRSAPTSVMSPSDFHGAPR